MNRICSTPNVVLVRYDIGRRRNRVAVAWRWLRRDGAAQVSRTMKARLEGRLSWKHELAARIAADARLERPQLLLLMADRNLNYMAGPLHLAEARQMIGDLPASSRGRGVRRLSSAAVDAVGSCVLVRALHGGWIEAIPYSAIEHDRCKTPSNPRSIEASFLAPLPDRSLRSGGFDSMALDAARACPASIPDHACQATIAALFWNRINPAFGSVFASAEGCFLAGCDDEAGIRRAASIIQAAFLAFFEDPDGSIDIALPLEPFGLPTVTSSRVIAKEEQAWKKFHAVADLAIAGISAWCRRAADGHAIVAAPDLAKAISHRTITIDSGGFSSGHDRLEAYHLVAAFWHSARRDPFSDIALRGASRATIDALDREFPA